MPMDDGKRLRACLKRLELHLEAKPKIGGCQGEAPARRGRPTDFGHMGAHFRSKIDLKHDQNLTLFFDRFGMRFGSHFGAILGAKLVQNPA